MKAVNHYIIIEQIKDEPKKVAGLILTENVDDDNRYLKAKVISIGNLVEGINEYRTQTSEQLKIHKHDLYVNTNLREKVDKMLDAIKEMKGGRRKSLKKKKSNKN